VRALQEVGATVVGIGERPKDWLDGDVRHWLAHYEQVPSVVDEERMIETVRWVQQRVPVDRLEATVEAHVMAAAQVREACGIPGTSVRTAFLCRDKPAMKEALRAAGIPCARSTGASSGPEVRAFAAEVGFPLILKPTAGAGASGAHRVDGPDELDEAIARSHVDLGATVAVEEFVEGHEGFYDTIAIDGQVVHDFATHYYPNVLEAMRTRWISPQLVTTNRIDTAPAYAEVRELGQAVVKALGIGTSATHMEWFAGPKGLKFSEIGCRPPGVRCWDLYAAANEFDIYREWAMAVVHGHPSQTLSRRFSAGMIALRPDRDGQISGYEGVDAMQERYGSWVIDAHLPPAGTPTQPVEAGYMANAWVRMRHPDYDELRRMLDDVGRTIQVHA
jgi:formate-dependent phosphoribosylglycinamide formyltransferase (GAR transformylase)